MEIAEKENGKKWLLWLKTAIIIGYFLGTMSFSRWDIITIAPSLGGLLIGPFISNLIGTILFFYGLTWVYRWVTQERFKIWDKQTTYFVLCGVGIRIAVNLCMYQTGGDINLLRMYGVAHGFAISISLLVTVLLWFFAVDKKKKKKGALGNPLKWIGRISLIICLICIGLMTVNLLINTPVKDIQMINNEWEYIEYVFKNAAVSFKETVLMNFTYDLGLAAVIALFLLLWVRTEPKKHGESRA